MSDTDRSTVQWSENDFLENAIIEAFVPGDSELNFQELIESWESNGAKTSNSIVPFVEQRQLVLLGDAPRIAMAISM